MGKERNPAKHNKFVNEGGWGALIDRGVLSTLTFCEALERTKKGG